MQLHNVLTKSNSVTAICKICFKDIKRKTLSSLFENEPCICSKCLKELNPDIRRFKEHGYKYRSIYSYNEKVRSLIFQFKGCFDIELAPIFLSKQSLFLKMLYFGYVLCAAPSYSERDKERGFNHVVEIFKSIGLPIIYPFIKEEDIKQADLNHEERANIKKYIKWNDRYSVAGKNVLFVDDIITTGFTSKTCMDLLKAKGAKKVKALILARRELESNKVFIK